MVLDANFEFFLTALIALFSIINPFSTASVFISITPHKSVKERILIAQKACWTAAFLLILFAVAGNFILTFFRITVDAFRIGGGILVFYVGFKMIYAEREYFQNDKEKKHAIAKEDISIIPLAIPMLSGPGALTTAIVIMSSATDMFESVSVIFAIILVCLLAFVVLSQSHWVEERISPTGKRIISKIMGLIVLVIGIQFIINGVTGVVTGWL